jgi:hypothetical protein
MNVLRFLTAYWAAQLKHQPGRHDQKTHGHPSAGGGVWETEKYSGSLTKTVGENKAVIRPPSKAQFRDDYEVRVWKKGTEWWPIRGKTIKDESEAKAQADRFLAGKFSEKYEFVPHTVALQLLHAGINAHTQHAEAVRWLDENYKS